MKEFVIVQRVVFFGLFSVALIALFLLFKPYLFAFLWAAILAGIFYPLHRYLASLVSYEALAAGLSVCCVVLVVLIPFAVLSSFAITEAIDIVSNIDTAQGVTLVQNVLHNPKIASIIEPLLRNGDIASQVSSITSNAGKTIISWIQIGSKNTFGFFVQLFIMLYALYYFFKDGSAILEKILHFIPLGKQHEKVLVQKFIATSKTALKSLFIVGGIQSLLGVIGLLIAGVPAVTLLFVFMLIVSVIPVIGPPFILFLASLYAYFVMGSVSGTLTLLIFAVIVGVIDNLIRPQVIGGDLHMHPLLILISILGGLALFGMSGIVLGPIVIAFVMALLAIYEKRYRTELAEH